MSLSIKVVKPLPLPPPPDAPDTPPVPVADTLPAKITSARRNRKYNWVALRQDYIRENLEPGNLRGMSIHAFAEKNGLHYPTVNMRAQTDGWDVAVAELREELADQASRQLIAKVGMTEMEVRTKQAKYAALAIHKAVLKLMTVNPEDLSVKDATKLLQMGLTEERRALGLVESVSMVKTEAQPQEEKVSAASKALAILERRRALKTIEQEITDVDSKEIP